MKASEANLLDLIQQSPQFIIPIYQRTYSWKDEECRQLWADILRAGSSPSVSGHFVGSIVYVESGLSQASRRAPLMVIDGQQRLTTVTLVLAALEKRDEDDREPVEGFSPLKVRHYYLVNPLETGNRHGKLLLTQTDKDTLTALVQRHDLPDDQSLRVAENYALFQRLIAGLGGDLVTLCQGLAKLVVVDIALNRDQDNPQLIFESMNSTGRELSQADLIRNFVLMGLEPPLQSHLYATYWRPMEIEFGQEAYGEHFDGFIRHFLTVKTGEIPKVDAVYEAFKMYARRTDVAAAGVEALVADLRRFARYFCAMALGTETDQELAAAFHDLRELKVDVAYPLLLEVYHDWQTALLPRSDVLEAVRLIESYVFRRAMCAIPTNSLNKTFSTFGRALRKDRYLESIKAHFAALPSYRRFPDDDEFMRELAARDMYNIRNRSYWLRRLENFGRKERVPVEDYTIEHILPQNENLSPAWRTMLGPDWQRVHHEYLHTLGNLTLTGYNAEYSDRPFLEKRDMAGGFRHSPLRLNAGLGQQERWDEPAIRERAHALADQARCVWPSLPPQPELPKPHPAQSRPEYSQQDHPYLLASPMRELFEAFRSEVLALDPCVEEEFLKLYVAYKAETNFVDVVPQAKRLRLSLNMAFPDLYDPRGIAKDVTGLGRWGNGDVEIGLASLDELPYVMGLVRQSLERQLSSEGEA